MAVRGSPIRRLLGLETEYAIRFAPQEEHPGNDVLFQAIRDALSYLVATRPGHSAPGRDQLFVQNGGAFYYEYLPHCLWGGLVEGATPECRGPAQLVLYQRAQESLLREAIPIAEERLRLEGFPGKLGLLKNSRDAEGHVYGSQENYEATVAQGLTLVLYRTGVALLLPVLAVQTIVTYALVLLTLVAVLVSTLVMLFVPRWRRTLERISDDQRHLEILLGRFQLWFTLVVTWPITALFARLLKLLAFRRIRAHMLAFLVSRSVLVGAGSVDGERRFRLGEKAQAIRQLIRHTILPEDRPIFDTGNMIKMLAAPFNLQIAPVGHLFRARQRLQLNLADSNRADVAEYLKVGTASLVLDMIEAGFLNDAPQLKDPVKALHAVVADPSLSARLELRAGPAATALELQRFYLDRAREYLRRSTATSIEARQLIQLWQETLTALESGNPADLVGRLDWVTKRFLLERCGWDSDEATLKTLDLRYHELGEGYFDELAKAGETTKLTDDYDVRVAMREPPEDSPAFVRGELIRNQAGSRLRVVVSWDSAYIGKPLRGKVIPFRRPNRTD